MPEKDKPSPARIIRADGKKGSLDAGKDVYYQYAFGKRPQIELYDIRQDEECLTNLAADPAYRETVKEMVGVLFRFLIETEDPRLVLDKDYFDKFPLLTAKRPYSWYAYTHGYWEKQTF